jgi:hypothetical protein
MFGSGQFAALNLGIVKHSGAGVLLETKRNV